MTLDREPPFDPLDHVDDRPALSRVPAAKQVEPEPVTWLGYDEIQAWIGPQLERKAT